MRLENGFVWMGLLGRTLVCGFSVACGAGPSIAEPGSVAVAGSGAAVPVDSSAGGTGGSLGEHGGVAGVSSPINDGGGSDIGTNGDSGYAAPLPGDTCVTQGALACAGGAQPLRLACESGRWVSNGSCDIGENCNQQSGECLPTIAQCQGKEPGQQACDGDILGQCGPDLVTFDSQQACATTCVEFALSAQCVSATCGDGTVQVPEECDDGDTTSTDECTNFCTDATCGDGVTWAGQEECDDGNASSIDDCTNACDAPSCGDGFVWDGHEQCDDGTLSTDDSCMDCAWAVVQVAVGDDHVCAIGGNGSLKCWGGNAYGQLGLEDSEERGVSPAQLGDNLPAIDLGNGRTCSFVASGDRQTCARLDDDSVKCWGYNYSGKLGLEDDLFSRGSVDGDMGDSLPLVDLGVGVTAVQFALGFAHACALLDDGSLKCWGSNYYGQLGFGEPTNLGDDPDEMGDELPTVDLGSDRTVVDVSAGGNHTCAILDDGTVKCWGIRGVLGSTERFNHWGDEPQEMGQDLPPVDLGTGRTAVHIVSGNTHNCALLDNGTVKCWGYNAYGQLGLGDTFNRPNPDIPTMGMGDELPAVELGDERSAVSITAGFDHTCAILDDETVKCWGSNSNGQLGMGDSDDRGDEESEMGDALLGVDLGADAVASEVHAGGGFFTCALLNNNTVKCWGTNSYGSLGIGDFYNRGDDPNEMGDDLPPVILTF